MTGKKAIQERNAKHLATVHRANALKAREQEEREAAFAAREMRRARIRARLHDDCAEQRETVAAARANAGDAHAADRMRNAATCHRARSLGEEQRALDVEIAQVAKETGKIEALAAEALGSLAAAPKQTDDEIIQALLAKEGIDGDLIAELRRLEAEDAEDGEEENGAAAASPWSPPKPVTPAQLAAREAARRAIRLGVGARLSVQAAVPAGELPPAGRATSPGHNPRTALQRHLQQRHLRQRHLRQRTQQLPSPRLRTRRPQRHPRHSSSPPVAAHGPAC